MSESEQTRTCRDCGAVLKKRQHSKPPRQKNKGPNSCYFLYWFHCPGCHKTYFEESARRFFNPEKQRLQDDALRDGLVREGIRPIDPVTAEAHSGIKNFLADPNSVRKLSKWERNFLPSLLKFQTFSQKQLNCLERIIGPLSYNRSLLDPAPVETNPRELPLQLEPNKKMMTCVSCGQEFELHPNKPEKINECIRCLIERQTGKAKAS
jgi:hypothetical protein